MKTRYWVAGIGLALGVFRAEGCGGDFPLMLTSCRAKCLEQIKAPGFAWSSKHVMGVDPQGPPAVEENDNSNGPDRSETSPTIRQMREEATGEAAYSIGEGLPAAKRLYTAGAVEFNRAHHSTAWGEPPADQDGAAQPGSNDVVDKKLTAAIGWFEQVIALPASEAEPRMVPATYMLGRSYFLRNRPGDLDSAAAQYQKTIERVTRGSADPLGLANAALGELGRIAMKQNRLNDAVALYTKQAAASGANHAVISLWRILGAVASDDVAMQRELHDPTGQKALIAFALTNLDDTCTDDPGRSCGDDSFTSYYRPEPGPARAIAVALSKLDPKDVQWPDQAAAIEYAVADFETMDRLLKRTNSPYAEWLRAKMALHAGDTEGAAKAFALASKAFALDDPTSAAMYGHVSDRVLGESGIIALSRKDYLEALYQLTASKAYGEDARYIAERVLTLDELKTLVDKETWAAGYRDLLARRLMRAERVDEAVPYYTVESAVKAAPDYAAAWHAATTGTDAPTQAKGWYEVSRLELEWGMELAGTDGCPDYYNEEPTFPLVCQKPPEPTEELGSEDEQGRVTASATTPDLEFHYRTVAVAHLFKAVDRLPRKSELVSVMLCNGANWLHHHNWNYNEDLIKSIYSRYVRDGRREPWAQNFGSTCPEPNFP